MTDPTVSNQPVATTGPPPAQSAPPVRERAWWEPVPFGPGQLVALIGAVALLVACFLDWIGGGAVFGDATAGDVPVEFLFEQAPESTDPSLLIVLIPLVILGAIGACWGFVTAGLRLVAGLGTLIVVGLFAFQLGQVVDDSGAGDLGDALGTGWYVAALAGFLLVVSAFVPTAWRVRRTREIPPAV